VLRRLTPLALGAALLAPTGAQAATVDVCPNPGECDFTRIQAAVNAADPGDSVNVGPGRYQETVLVDKRLEINGAQSGADARDQRRGGESRVGAQNGGFVIGDSPEDDEPPPDGTTIDGFTIFRAGSSGGASTFDAGISVLFNGGPVSGLRITNNVISDNVLGLQLNSGGERRTIVKRNFFRANNNDGGEGEEQGNGIYTDIVAANVLVERNEFTAHQNEAMLIANRIPPASAATGIDIVDNDLRDDSGIVVANARDVLVAENSSRGNVDDDVIDDDVIEMGGNVDGANITDNHLSRYDGAGVAISDDRGAGPNRNVSIVGNTLLGNNDVDTDRGVRLLGNTYEGRLDVEFNRIFRNSIGVANEDSDPGEQIKAENNWWGSNERPGTPPSDSVAGNVDAGPRLQMRLESRKAVRRNGRQLKVRASLQFNSEDDGGGQRFNPSPFPNGTVVRFRTDRGRITKRVQTIGGVADAILVTRGSTGKTRIRAKLDGEELKRNIRIRG
jgi:hypothetical protein